MIVSVFCWSSGAAGTSGGAELRGAHVAVVVPHRDKLQCQDLELATEDARDGPCSVPDLCIWQGRVE